MGNMTHIFHHNDADGYAAAAIIIKYYIGDNEEYTTQRCNYNTLLIERFPKRYIKKEELLKGCKIFVLDYSPETQADIDFLISLEEKGAIIIWIDHHKSSQNRLDEGNEYLQRWANEGKIDASNQWSGAMLSWFWCHDHIADSELCNASNEKKFEKAPLWLKYVDDYDTWKHKMKPDSISFVAGVTNATLRKAFLDKNESYSSHVSPEAPGITDKYVKSGKILTKYREAENRMKIKGMAFEITLSIPDEGGNKYTAKCLAINAGGNSLLFEDWFNKYDAVISFYFNGTKYVYNMFSSEETETGNNIDCSKFAEYFGKLYLGGGGGHYHAAGWQTSHQIFESNNITAGGYIEEMSRYDFVRKLDGRGE